MSRCENIEFTLRRLRKTGKTVFVPERGKITSAAQNFMYVALMSDVKNDLITGKIKYPVYRKRKLNDAEV